MKNRPSPTIFEWLEAITTTPYDEIASKRDLQDIILEKDKSQG